MQRLRAVCSRPVCAGLLVGLAVGAWGYLFHWWKRILPVRQHLEAGMNLLQQGEGAKAEDEFKTVLRLDPRHASACHLLAQYYMTTNQWLKAMEAFERLKELAPDEPHLDCRLAACYLRIQDEARAYRHAEAELRRDPECVSALAIAAVLLERMHQQKSRLTYLRRLAQLQSENVDIQMLLAEALKGALQTREARRVLERLVQRQPEQPGAYGLLAELYLEDPDLPDRLERAKALLYEALRRNPLSGMSRLTLGRVYLQQRQPHRAVFQLEQAAKLMPENYFVFLELSRALTAAGDPARAAHARQRFLRLRQAVVEESALQKRCAAFPDNAEYHYQLGLIKLRKGNYREAFYYLNRAYTLKPGDRRTVAALETLAKITGTAPPTAALEQKATQSLPEMPR
ncbi:MAG: tetratricopeptide repeat protein [Abditibacteriales bacterium]|nr:tetratricopeptide repeat protein [Abditibacteriales bacterium]MDW8365976.1 tetratricopeptide repeat protein [Abditibacteriales bacterium]